MTGGRSYKHRSEDQVMTIDWSWLICGPVVKGRFDERLRDGNCLRAFRHVYGKNQEVGRADVKEK